MIGWIAHASVNAVLWQAQENIQAVAMVEAYAFVKENFAHLGSTTLQEQGHDISTENSPCTVPPRSLATIHPRRKYSIIR
jgi:hypothetical protein